MRLPDTDVVAVDTETSGLHPDDGARVASVALAWEDDTLALPFDQGVRDKLPAAQLELTEAVEGDPNLGEAEWKQLLDWLSERRLVLHNAKFDLTLLKAGTRHWPGADLLEALYWDTMVASSILDPREKEGLDEIAQRYSIEGKIGLDEVIGWLKARGYYKADEKRYDLAPWDLIKPYVTRDAAVTWQVFDIQTDAAFQSADTDDGATLARLEREFELTRALARMEWRGLQYDAEQSLEVAEELERRAADIEKRMPFQCEVNAAKRYYFQEKGMHPDRTTENGNPSLDEETVRAWRARGVEWADEYYQVTRAKRAVSMWFRGYPEKIGLDGRLRTSYKQTRVKSGRMSVERVQLQAMPKSDKYGAVGSGERLPIYEGMPDVRDLLQAREGHGLWSLDFSQAELRVASDYSRCERMLEMLRNGADVHGETCQRVLGAYPGDPDWKTKRDVAKRLTFGSIFMIGGQKFQETLAKLADIHWPIEQCISAVNNWRRLYPEFGEAYRLADKMAGTKKYVRLLPRTKYEVRSYFAEDDWSHTGWNRIVQGSLAEFFKLWTIEVERQWPGYLILTIHDSVLLEAPLDEGEELAHTIARAGQAMATELLMRPETGVVMPVDVDRWDKPAAPDKATKGDDQYAGVS